MIKAPLSKSEGELGEIVPKIKIKNPQKQRWKKRGYMMPTLEIMTNKEKWPQVDVPADRAEKEPADGVTADRLSKRMESQGLQALDIRSRELIGQ